MSLQSPCTQKEFNAYYQLQRVRSNFIFSKNKLLKCNIFNIITSLFPVFSWLPSYKIKKDLARDLQSGFTVAVLHIPQGMGYAALGGVHPIVGIYMAIFPVIVYFLMGTSRHISLGSFSIVCLMVGKPVSEYSGTLSAIEVATVVSLIVGLIQVLLGFCRAGSLSMFMSDSLISGFTTGAAILVTVSQLEYVFGVKLERRFGIFNTVYTVVDLFRVISKTNFLSLAMSLGVISFLTLYTDFVKPKIKCRYMLPMELITMIVGTMASYLFDFKNKYSINIVGDVPTGLPFPSVPQISLETTQALLIDSIIIAVVSFSVQVSMATLFALEEDYIIDPSQELVATGFANIFGSFFSCLPVGVSLSRSFLQFSSGGKTQLASLFSSLFLISIVLYFGKFLEPLPYAVLAGIVITSLKTFLMQTKDLLRIWKYSFYDGVVWLITCLSIVFLNIEIGLAIAIIISLFSIILLNQNVYVCLLGRVPNTDLFLEIERYPMAEPVPNFIIVQIHAGLHFANILLAISKMDKLIEDVLTSDETLVLDMSTVTFVDPEALNMIKNYILTSRRIGFRVVLTRVTGRVYEQMRNCDFFENISDDDVFPSIQDAVSYNIEQTTSEEI